MEILAHNRWVPLGQYLAAEAEEISVAEIFNVAEQLRRARTQLNEINALMRSDPDFAREYGKKVIEAEQQYSKAASAYQAFRAAVGQEWAPGISGHLGQVVTGVLAGKIVVGVIAAAKFTAAVTALYWLSKFLIPLAEGFLEWQKTKGVEAQTQQETKAVQHRQVSSIESQQRVALARNDVAGWERLEELKRQLLEKLAANGNGQGPFEFFRDNWGWLLLGVGAIVVGPRIVDAISDR